MAVIGIYNGLVRLNVQANNAWADIDVQLSAATTSFQICWGASRRRRRCSSSTSS
jgi:hypothetical protein